MHMLPASYHMEPQEKYVTANPNNQSGLFWI